MFTILFAAALALETIPDFKAAFPTAVTIESSGGGRLTHASGFEAAGLGDTPEAAARAFMARFGDVFGVTPRQELVARATPAPGQPGPVRFERRIEGLPLFDGDVVVGVDARNAVILVNCTDVPTQVVGRARISRKAAVRIAKAAISGLEVAEAPRVQRGWRAAGQVVRPVWRVDFIGVRPPGDWRSYVDAQTGRVLLRLDLRANTLGPSVSSKRERLAPATKP